jgi:hypothetical protein
MKRTRIFIVTNSSDGRVGAYTTKKAAWACAVYCAEEFGYKITDKTKSKKEFYAAGHLTMMTSINEQGIKRYTEIDTLVARSMYI